MPYFHRLSDGNIITAGSENGKLFWLLNEKISTTTFLYENKPLIGGITITIYKTGNMVTCKISGSPGVNIDIGAKNAYADLPDAYLPAVSANQICITQNGKRYIANIGNVTKKAGFYYALDDISAGDNVYDIISWAAKVS